MKKYIALLRAINVGGHRKIKIQDLRDMFETMGFDHVQTYIQSGNVIFDSDENDPKKLSQSIEEQIKSDFDHEVPVMIRTHGQFKNIIDQNPFDGQSDDCFKLYITFFLETPSNEKQQELKDLSNDIEIFDFVNGELFSLIDKKTDQKVNFSNNFVEKIAGIPGTVRNWKSVNKIFEMANNPAR